MSDAQTVAGAIAGGIASVPPLLLLGVQVDALVIGLFAALLVSIWTEGINNRLKAASAVLLSSLMAGYGSPVAANWLANNYPAMVSSPTHDTLRMLCALVIGAAMPSVVPIAIRWANRKWGTP